MTQQQVIDLLAERGVALRLDTGKLKAAAKPGVLNEELRQIIKENRDLLVDYLAQGNPDNAEVEYPLSPTQLRQAAAAREGAVLPIVLRLRGAMNIDALERSLAKIVERHAPLRSSFHLDADPPYQREHVDVSVALARSDLSAQQNGEEEALKLLAGLTQKAFDVSVPPPVRYHLVRLGPEDHVFYAAFSPLVIDGWSFDIFWQEFRSGYIAFSEGRPYPYGPLQSSYREQSKQQSQRLEKRRSQLEGFWSSTLGSVLPSLPLPTDRIRPNLSDNRGGNVTYRLPLDASDALRVFARSEGSTPQMVMLTAFYGWLYRLSGVTDLVVAGPAAARLHPDAEELMGPFVNIMLMRMKVEKGITFRSFVHTVRDRCLDAYDHQELPLEQLRVRSSRSGGADFSPAFQTEFSFQQVSHRSKDMGSLTIDQFELPSGAATNDLIMWVKDWGEEITGAIEFKTEIFEKETVATWLQCFESLISQWVAAPDEPLEVAQLLSAEQVTQLEGQLSSQPRALVESCLGRAFDGVAEEVSILDSNNQKTAPRIYGELVVRTRSGTYRSSSPVRLNAARQLEVLPASAVESQPQVEYRAPLTDTETQVTDIFQQLLQVERLGLDDDFFAQGGNSLLAVRLFSEIKQRFGVRLPFAAILDSPTPFTLARRVRGGGPSRTGCLLPLREGAGSMGIYLVHDGDGETLLYRNLARRMVPGPSVYGVAPPLEGGKGNAFASITRLAAHYAGEIRAHQPEGPYVVGGLCAGGVLAYEVARQLAEIDGKQTCLVLLDAAPPFATKRQSKVAHRVNQLLSLAETGEEGTMKEKFERGVRRLRGGLEYELGEMAKSVGRTVKAKLNQRLGDRAVGELPEEAETAFRDIWLDIETKYERATSSQVATLLVRATAGGGGDTPTCDEVSHPLFDWDQLIEGEIVVLDVPGGHSSMLQEPQIDEWAPKLQQEMERLVRFQ